MEVSITKMSQNGQVVIPLEIRKDAKLSPKTKFLVFNEGNEILLKPIIKDNLKSEIELLSRIEKSEREISSGKIVKAETKMSAKKIDNLLMGD